MWFWKWTYSYYNINLLLKKCVSVSRLDKNKLLFWTLLYNICMFETYANASELLEDNENNVSPDAKRLIICIFFLSAIFIFYGEHRLPA